MQYRTDRLGFESLGGKVRLIRKDPAGSDKWIADGDWYSRPFTMEQIQNTSIGQVASTYDSSQTLEGEKSAVKFLMTQPV